MKTSGIRNMPILKLSGLPKRLHSLLRWMISETMVKIAMTIPQLISSQSGTAGASAKTVSTIQKMISRMNQT